MAVPNELRRKAHELPLGGVERAHSHRHSPLLVLKRDVLVPPVSQ